MSKQKPTILVTGFGPFPGAPENPSGALVKAMVQERLISVFCKADIICAILPTHWQKVAPVLTKLFDQHDPEYALHLGYASGSAGFQLESTAFNQTCAEVDVDGTPGSCGAILKHGPAKITSTLPLQKLQDQLTGSGRKVSLNNDPGRYLCNKAYYLSLARSRSSLFIHIPALKTAKGLIPKDHHGDHHLPLSDALEGLQVILATLVASPHDSSVL